MHFLYIFFFVLAICAHILYNKWINVEDFDGMQKISSIGSGIGVGSTVKISFCSSCSHRGHAVTMKHMLEAAFPGIHIVLGNHPPPLLQRLLSKVITTFQVGVIVIIMGGEHIFPQLGYITPPPWHYFLRANRYGTISSTWFFGNFIHSYLQSSGAFEVFCNGDLIFSKLMEYRFPSEFELRELVSRKLANLGVVGGLGRGIWS
ncbi:hypothetical protein Patl1_31353 [Pistacia atlantica]|uniref:Uncharacterized protein n=1 Tax=Pistacia atlantica TaxID=434234 RepID=A0ACC1APJ1_9ROSI|nr:hypothetical protein Patl1_31353 [Pistacia atlantica]